MSQRKITGHAEHISIYPGRWDELRGRIDERKILFADKESCDLIVYLDHDHISALRKEFLGDVSTVSARICGCPQCNSIMKCGMSLEESRIRGKALVATHNM